MTLGVLAVKEGMTQLFVDGGVRLPVTVLKVPTNTVVAHRQQDRDGYTALQVGCGHIRPALVNKPRAGQFAKAKVEPTRFLREFRVSADHLDKHAVGSEIDLGLFEEGASVQVSGTSIGKGFAGVMKRHGFGGFPASHGTHESFRGPGSIGQCEQPGKVFKGKRMAGHMGNKRATVSNLRVARILEKEQALCVVGAVPGPKGCMVEVRLCSRRPKAIARLGDAAQKKSKNPMKSSKSGSKK